MALKKVQLPGSATAIDIQDSRIPGVDSTPTSGSENVVTSGGVYNNSPFLPGDGTNSAVQKGNSGKNFGASAVLEGESTVATPSSITASTSDSDIITAWEEAGDNKFSVVKGEGAHAEGANGLALGNHSHVEGNGCLAADNSSHAEGTGSQAYGKYAHAEGLETIAIGTRSHTEGFGATAYNKEGHAEGLDSISGIDPSNKSAWSSSTSYSTGDVVVYNGYVYTATKNSTNKTPSGSSSYWRREEAQHAEGKGTTATARAAHAEGISTTASGEASHAEGSSTTASAKNAHVEGASTSATASNAHAEGESSTANAWASHTEGYLTETGGTASSNTKTPDNDGIAGQMAHAEGNATLAKGNAAHSEGRKTFAAGANSHAEGYQTSALGDYGSHSEGDTTKAEGNTAHAEGEQTWALGINSHAEGYMSKTGGNDSSNTLTPNTNTSSGRNAHAEGNATLAKGRASHAEGTKTFARNESEHAEGMYNVSINGITIHTVGIGTSSQNKNAHTITGEGKHYILGIGGYAGTETSLPTGGDLANVVNGKAPLASPALTGTPTTPTAAVGTNTTQIASTAFVQNAITAIDCATLEEIDALFDGGGGGSGSGGGGGQKKIILGTWNMLEGSVTFEGGLQLVDFLDDENLGRLMDGEIMLATTNETIVFEVSDCSYESNNLRCVAADPATGVVYIIYIGDSDYTAAEDEPAIDLHGWEWTEHFDGDVTFHGGLTVSSFDTPAMCEALSNGDIPLLLYTEDGEDAFDSIVRVSYDRKENSLYVLGEYLGDEAVESWEVTIYEDGYEAHYYV